MLVGAAEGWGCRRAWCSVGWGKVERVVDGMNERTNEWMNGGGDSKWLSQHFHQPSLFFPVIARLMLFLFSQFRNRKREAQLNISKPNDCAPLCSGHDNSRLCWYFLCMFGDVLYPSSQVTFFKILLSQVNHFISWLGA